MERRKKRKTSFSHFAQTQSLIMNSTLEHMALVKIVTTLWNHDDIRKRFRSEISRKVTCPRKRLSAWEKMESMIKEKVLKLLLPERLKVKVISCIKPIGLEIMKWIESHVEAPYLAIKLPSEFCWTSHGKIDKQKTAVVSIKDERNGVTKRFRLACIYCLENDIKILSPRARKIADNYYTRTPFRHGSEHPNLVHIWHSIRRVAELPLVNEENTLPFHQYAFECAAQEGHKAALEFFFQKLTLFEREESLVRTATSVMFRCINEDSGALEFGFNACDHGDVFRFLLSHMDDEQLLEILKVPQSALFLLVCYLDWPWQDFFLETARYVQELLSKDEFENILNLLIKKIKKGFKDFEYQKLFCELFQLIPETHKTYVNRNVFGCLCLEFPASLLPSLFKIKDKENISLILKDATAEKKDEIIFCIEGRSICFDLARASEWDLFEDFLTECIASQEKLIQYREEIKKWVAPYAEAETDESE